jgi:hypothetical protein
MKRKFFTVVSVALLGLLLVSPAVFAYPAIGETVTFYDALGSGPGGEFSMTGVGGPYPDTFCVQTQVHLQFGTPYTVAGYIDPTGGAAWLYYNFAMGTLPGLGGGSYGTTADADALQVAIWQYQTQTIFYGSWPQYQPYELNNYYYQLASGKDYTIALDHVVVLDIVQYGNQTGGPTSNSTDIQNVLGVRVPEPATLMLLGLGLLGIGIVSRKKK